MSDKRKDEALTAMRETLELSRTSGDKTKTVTMRLDPDLKRLIDEVARLRRMQTGDDVRFSEVARELLHAGLERKLSELEESGSKES